MAHGSNEQSFHRFLCTLIVGSDLGATVGGNSHNFNVDQRTRAGRTFQATPYRTTDRILQTFIVAARQRRQFSIADVTAAARI